MAETSHNDLRVACLLPSATDIIVELNLLDHLVGVTHECDNVQIFDPNESKSNDSNDDKPRQAHNTALRKSIQVLTISQIDPHDLSQSSIHEKVQDSLSKQISLYNINEEAFLQAQPNVILTQTLCDVCAPSISHVKEAVSLLKNQTNQCEMKQNKNSNGHNIEILSLEPECLEDVADTFVTVGNICGVEEDGKKLKEAFWSNLNLLRNTIESKDVLKPRLFMLEWLEPPFDGGHWVLGQMEFGGCEIPNERIKEKSKQRAWEYIQKMDPDCIVVACCGFDLQRNMKDAQRAQSKLKHLRAYRNNRIYAANGNLYFARPGPYLVGGAALLARCAYDDNEDVTQSLEALPFTPKENVGWCKVNFDIKSSTIVSNTEIEDIEDMDFIKIHNEACNAKQHMYIDPQSGFSVFTEYAHLQRGKCCGSGCRHCPYNHINLKDKVHKIQQPSLLCEKTQKPFLSLHNNPIKVLFFSGGKDSFLTLRALVRQSLVKPFALLLITTFDASSRIVAHQEISIQDIVKQAEHLQIPLMGVPLHRGSSERYVNRIHRALSMFENVSLVFGDLHLEHIRHWRDTELNQYSLEYPLWNIPYSQLMEDLEKSTVPIEISACTVSDTVAKVGTNFTRSIWDAVEKEGLDGFGENGEFHSIAQVWKVKREVALGLNL